MCQCTLYSAAGRRGHPKARVLTINPLVKKELDGVLSFHQNLSLMSIYFYPHLLIVLCWLGIKIRNQIRIEQCRFKFSIKTSWFQVVRILPRQVIQKDGYFSVRLTVKPRYQSIKIIANAHPYPNILWEWSLIISNWSSQVLGITLIVTDIHWNQTPLFLCSLINVFYKRRWPSVYNFHHNNFLYTLPCSAKEKVVVLNLQS